MTSIATIFRRRKAELASWLRSATDRNRVEAEMEAELADHLDRLTADLIRAGQPPTEAARRARIALGQSLTHKEGMRASLGLRWSDELRADLRYAVRLLRRSPGFTAIAAGSLALAIGANTTIFSIAKRVLLDRLNVRHPEQLRLLSWQGDKNVAVHGIWGDWNPEGNSTSSKSFSYPAYEELRKDNRVLDELFAFKGAGRMNATVNGAALVVQGELVSGNYFAQLGVVPQLGRPILPADDTDGAPPVSLASDGFWKRSLGGSRDAVGHTIKVNMTPVTIIGVTPKDFTGAKSAEAMPDLFLPLSVQPVVLPKGRNGSMLHDASARMWWLNIMGREKPGVKAEQARAALNVALEDAVRASLHPGAKDTIPRLVLRDGSRGLFEADGLFGQPLRVLMAVVGLVLLLACANIASLLMARASNRQREISVRMAVGASRGRVLRQVLTESMLLAGLGGAFGLVLAFFARNGLPALVENAWDNTHLEVPFDWGVFAFTAGVTLLTGLLFGILPAMAATRTEVSSGLKEQSQSTTRRRSGLSGKAIVAFQMMLSTVLIVGALLFVRTLWNLSRIDPGFNTDHLLLFSIDQPKARYPHPAEIELHRRIEEKLRALPGVQAVTVAQEPYLSDSLQNDFFLPEGDKRDDSKNQSAFNNMVGPGFFTTMGIPMMAGREFTAQDTASSKHVAVISALLAKSAFPGVNPIGRHFYSHQHLEEGNHGMLIEVVGICGDIRYSDLKNEPVGMFYEPYAQAEELEYGMTYEIRTRMSPGEMAPALRRAVQSIDPDLPIQDLRTQREQIDATMETERIFAALTLGFGVLALALACVGVYGVMAYSVARRTQEIGIRLALGALPRQVLSMVLREASWLGAVGIGAGIGAALLLTRLVKSMLFGLQPADPASMAGAVALLAVVGLAASLLPARRAASVEPVVALRQE